jgi:hypothetical protein
MKTNQSLASIGRQVLAIVGVVFGVLTQSVSALHLPTAVSSILLVGGAVILAVEHYVSDPSTGSPVVVAPPASASQVSPSPAPAATAPAAMVHS